MSCPSPTRSVEPNGWVSIESDSGNVVISPDRPIQGVSLYVGGVARRLPIVLSEWRQRRGNILRIHVTLPAIAGIVLDFRNGTATGTKLLPAARYTDQEFTTDGEQVSGFFRFGYTGSAWTHMDSSIPA